MESCHSLKIDQACLHIINKDLDNEYELWAQSEECYECPPWKYLNLYPKGNYILPVNSTYPMNILIYKADLNELVHRYKYNFGQHGIYSLTFNSSFFGPIATVKQGNDEFVAIVVAAVLYISLYWFWLCILGLHSRMQENRNYPREFINRDTVTELVNNEGTVSHNTPVPEENFVYEIRSTPDSLSIVSRVQSLDTFRGIAIVLMIFVNYGGGKYYFFQHARWNGLTFADLVFPWFLWIMGFSITFSIKSLLRRMTPYYIIFLKITRRSVILFALGMVINSLQSNYLPTMRIPGVLQRFAICYFINASVEIFRMKPQDSLQYFRFWYLRDIIWSWSQWVFILALAITHTAITFSLSVPGCPKGYLGPGGLHANGSYPNCTGGAAGYIDQLLLGKKHIYQTPTCRRIYDNSGPFDPEGILGLLTSCLTVQLGLAAGRIIITYPAHMQRIKRWLIWALFLGLLGGLLCQWSKEGGLIPINKNLWSLSFVCVTASFAFILFSALYYIIDSRNYWDGTLFRVAGLNSILLYVGHEISGKFVPWSWSPVGQNHAEHLCMSLWGTSLWMIIAYICHKKKLYFSV